MPYLSPAQLATLRAELGKPVYLSLSRTEATDALNAPVVVSSGDPRQVPLPLSTRKAALMVLISEESIGKMISSQLLDRVLGHIDRDDHANFLLGVGIARKANVIKGQEALELQRMAMQTRPDPNHIPTRIMPSTFQTLPGLGDAEIIHPDGQVTRGTCYAEFIDEARAA